MAETKAPRRLDEALRPGGLYYMIDGTAHDAHGNVLEGAPKRPENTNPEDQPFARLASMTSVGPGGYTGQGSMEQLGMAIARGLTLASEGKVEDPNKAAGDNTSARDELASAAVDAKPAAPAPGKVVSVGDARIYPEMRPGGEVAAAAASAPATGTPPSTGTTTGTGEGSSSNNT
jgi:hypothetical protein